MTGAVFNAKWVEEIKRVSRFATPFIEASAVVGVTAFSHLIYDAAVRSAGRNIAAFDGGTEALDRLAAQQGSSAPAAGDGGRRQRPGTV